MAIDLTKLEKKFIDLFANVTQEEFEQWLLTKTKPMAQTAVEWFQEKTWELKMLLEKQQISVDEYGVAYYDILEEAKQMEREQKIKFADNYGFHICGYDYERAEQYYNETYGK